MYKFYLLKLQTYNIYITHQPLELETQLLWHVCDFLCVGLLYWQTTY